MGFGFLLVWCVVNGVGYDHGKSGFFDIRTTAHEVGMHEDGMVFPLFSLDSDPDVALKINRHLQLSELHLLEGYQNEHLFERVAEDHGTIYGGKVNMQSYVLTNTSRLLSVFVDQASCGMTCTYWQNYYNFNAGNGDLIQIEDLMDREDYERFRAYAAQKRIAELKKQIEDSEFNLRHLTYVIGGLEESNLRDFVIANRMLIIDGNDCLLKNDKFYGLDMTTQFSVRELAPYLNRYGKALFDLSDEPVGQFRSRSMPQLMSGYVEGTYPIFMLMRRSWENEGVGVYAYKKYGKGIPLDGTLSGTTLSFVEYDDLDTNGFIEGTFHENSVTGVWKDRTSKREYSFTATTM